jgi:sortase A
MAAAAIPAPTRRRWARPAAAVLALIGLVLIGQGAWIHAKALLAQVLLERAFAATIAGGAAVKPWPWADTWPVARVELPRLGAGAVVLHGSSGQALAFGPGHVAATPAAGEDGTAVYAAHRDTHFAFLRDVRNGDDILVTRADGARLRFRVDRTAVVRWDVSGIDAQAHGRALVLATCWPFEAATPGPERYVVHAQMVE